MNMTKSDLIAASNNLVYSLTIHQSTSNEKLKAYKDCKISEPA